jgi:hypothetical protein
MKSIASVALAAMLSFSGVGSVSATTSTPEPSWNSHANFRLIFDSTAAREWTPGWFGTGITGPVNSTETVRYDSANVSRVGSDISLTLTDKYGSLVSTNGHFSILYGGVEVRACIPGRGDLVYNWPAIWLDGQNWPQDGEFDIVEGLGGSPAVHVHNSQYPDGIGKYIPGKYTGCNNFGLWWSPGLVEFYYNGRPVWKTKTPNNKPMYLIVENSTSGIPRPTTMEIQWVRAWTYQKPDTYRKVNHG